VIRNLFGIALIRAASLEDAQALMAGGPAAVARVQSAPILPFSLPIARFDRG
jgi:hypothetical protein